MRRKVAQHFHHVEGDPAHHLALLLPDHSVHELLQRCKNMLGAAGDETRQQLAHGGICNEVLLQTLLDGLVPLCSSRKTELALINECWDRAIVEYLTRVEGWPAKGPLCLLQPFGVVGSQVPQPSRSATTHLVTSGSVRTRTSRLLLLSM